MDVRSEQNYLELRCLLVTLHVVFAMCGFAVMYLTMPMVSLYLYLVVLLIGLAIPVLNAATIDLYPTSMR